MTNQSTIDKLIEMHMTSMADAFRNQMQDISMKEIPFEDRFGMIVDIEYTTRKQRGYPEKVYCKLSKLILGNYIVERIIRIIPASVIISRG